MQMLAMLTMLVDHIGIVFFPEIPWLRCIGRLAMPLYAYALVLGYGRTRSFRRYALRLAVIAVLSQLPYPYALMGPDEPFEFNVVFTLLVSLAVLRLIDAAMPSASGAAPAFEQRGNAAAFGDLSPLAPRFVTSAVIAACGCLVLELLPFDYGAYLLLLVLIYRFTVGPVAAALHFFLNVLYILPLNFPAYQMFSLLSTLLVAYAPKALDRAGRVRVPRWLWLSFYPAHLAVLAFVRPFAAI